MGSSIYDLSMVGQAARGGESGPLPIEPELTDGSVRLRRWAMTDLACVEAASREGRIPPGTTVPAMYSDDAGRAWIGRQHTRRDQGRGWSLAACDVATDRAVGCVVLRLRPQVGAPVSATGSCRRTR